MNKLYSLHTLLIGIILIAFSLSSCKSTEKTYKTYHKDADYQHINKSPIIQTPLLVDLDVSETKEKGTFQQDSVSVKYAKSMALNNALKKSGSDVLIEPVYETTIEGVNVKVTVTGFPAKYTNFRKPTAADSIYIDYTSTNSVVLKQETPYLDYNLASKNTLKCDKMIRQGKSMTAIGASLMGIGMIAAGGMIAYDLSTNKHGNFAPGYGTSAMLLASGTIVLPLGLIRMKSGKKCR